MLFSPSNLKPGISIVGKTPIYKDKRQMMLLAIIILAILGSVYFLFFSGSNSGAPASSSVVANNTPSPNNSSVDKKGSAKLNLDQLDALLARPDYKALQSYLDDSGTRIEINSERGRNNPFLPY